MTALRQETVDLVQSVIPEESIQQVHDILITFIPKRVSREEGWAAFEDLRKQVQEAGVPEMTLDEINAEIEDARRERRGREAVTV